MRLNSNSKLCNINCYKPGQIRISYDRLLDKVYFSPCCSIFLKQFIEPLSFDYDKFINNIEYCLEQYKNFDLTRLSDYYYGKCEQVFPYSSICSDYTWNSYDIQEIELAIFRRCNLRCSMCKLDHSSNDREEQLHLKVLNYFKNKSLNRILYTAFGEPMLFKDLIFDFLENSKIKKHEIITNAMLLSEEDIIKLSKYKDKLIIAVSCDGISKNMYESIRIGGNFEKVFNNILLLKSHGLLQRVNYVMQDKNISEHNEVIPFFENLGIHLTTIIDGDFDLKNNKDLLNKNMLKRHGNYNF